MKKYYTLCMCFLLGVSVWAVDANEFLIGAYSQYQIRYAGNNYAANFDSLGGYLNNAGYNATVYSLSSGYSDLLSTIFEKLHESDIKSMLHDNTWSPTANKVGIGSLTFGNKLQIEAEYQLKTDSNGNFLEDELSTENESVCMESFDYVTQHEMGDYIANNPSYNTSYSNNYAWLCDASQGDSACVALSQPRKRWKPINTNILWPSMLSKDIVFLNSTINDNKLYLTVALRFENIPNGTPVADISLKLYDPPNPDIYSEYGLTDPLDYVNVTLTPTPVNSLYGTSIIAQTYPSAMQDSYGNYIFEYFVDLSTLISYMKGSANSATREFYHINPEVYWYGNGKITIDYLTIEDDFNRSVRTNQNSPYVSQIDSQINYITTNDTNNNLLYLMSMDEPRAGQLQMYKHMQNHLNSINPTRKMVTTMWLKDYGIMKHDGTPYNYHKRFLTESNPDRIMVDIYAISGSPIWNGHLGFSNHVQNRIDNMIHYYSHKLVTSIQQSDNPETEIFYVPQTFGIVLLPGSYPWSYQMPPRSMVKVLKYLPLCYAADGMVDFCVASNPNDVVEEGNWVTPLKHARNGSDQYNNLMVTENVSAYDMITDANRKIAVYGPIIKSLQWLNANKVMDTGISLYLGLEGEDGINLSSMLLNDLHVESEVDGTGYTGQVQCGYYNDNQGKPYFMLVNRRAVFELTGTDAPPDTTPIRNVDYFFNDAAPQTICLNPNEASHDVFGSFVGFYDPYDDAVYYQSGESVNVPIGPGDGKLLQMVGTLPGTVNSLVNIATKAIIEGNITIESGGHVRVAVDTELRVKKHATITIESGASFQFRGSVSFEDSVMIYVLPGGSVYFNGAICKWGVGSGIDVENATLTVTDGELFNLVEANTWKGIRATSSSTVVLDNSIINNAVRNTIIDSDLQVSNCIFNIPPSGYGLMLINNTGSVSTSIANTVSGKGFYYHGTSEGKPTGILLGAFLSPVIVDNVRFYSMNYGIRKNGQLCEQDSIRNCHFIYCNNGIGILSSTYSPVIESCSFARGNVGILLCSSSPYIANSSFNYCERGGIVSELAVKATTQTNGIFNCMFQNCGAGVESRNSNNRIKGCLFDGNQHGILSHAGSNLNLSQNANNVLSNQEDNINFYDTTSYQSTIQLLQGHNDFYHLYDAENNTYANDFYFSFYYWWFPIDFTDPHSTLHRFITIDASGNWFEDDEVLHNTPHNNNYVVVRSYDPEPNVTSFAPENNRISIALDYESSGNYSQALAQFKGILDEHLETERNYISCAADGVYRLSELVDNQSLSSTDYFLAKMQQYSEQDSTQATLLRSYLVKSYINAKRYQDAIDEIQLAIDNPVSEIDSLVAVMDLEIVLQLADMEDSKRPAITKYTQFKYPNNHIFSVKHDEHWKELYSLLDNKPNTNEIPIPHIPLISTNYPNPFNPSTTIAFSIPTTGNVKLCVYNIRGQKVKEVLNTDMEKGFHKIVWDGRDKNNRSVSSGIYFFRLESGGQASVRKAMLMK